MPTRKYDTPRPCEYCKKDFTPRIDNVRNGQGRFCSPRCRAKFVMKPRKVYKNCLYCHHRFHASPIKRRFCSRGCSVRFKHPNKNPDRELVNTRKRMSQFCCGLLKRCFRNKTDKTYVLLGYTAEELRIHLESKWEPGMSWSNYGCYGEDIWNIDHIKPIASFNPDASAKEINALSNLQPMWSIENYKKEKKYREQKTKI